TGGRVACISSMCCTPSSGGCHERSGCSSRCWPSGLPSGPATCSDRRYFSVIFGCYPAPITAIRKMSEHEELSEVEWFDAALVGAGHEYGAGRRRGGGATGFPDPGGQCGQAAR